MTKTIRSHPGMPRGIAHRARLRAVVLPKLRIGSTVPSSRFLGWLLGISGSEGYWHMRRVLAEAGIVTETRGAGRGRRVFVVSIPSMEVAA